MYVRTGFNHPVLYSFDELGGDLLAAKGVGGSASMSDATDKELPVKLIVSLITRMAL